MTSGTIQIQNLTGRTLQYRVDHQTVCVKAGKCFCKQGRRGPVAASIIVPGGEGRMTAPLHPAMSLIPKVKADASGPRPKIRIVGSSAGKGAGPQAQGSEQPRKPERESKGGGRKGRES